MSSSQQIQRRCVACGRPIEWGAEVCQYCGHDYRQTPMTGPKKNGTVLWIIVIILVGAILVPIVLAAILYGMVLGFGGTNDNTTPEVLLMMKSTIPNGFKMMFTAPTSEVVWSDVTFQLSDSSGHFQTWSPSSGPLTTSTPPAIWHDTDARPFGTFDVWLNVTDLAGNGMMSNGDFVTLQCVGGGLFSTSATYTLTLIYKPTGGSMLAYNFTG